MKFLIIQGSMGVPARTATLASIVAGLLDRKGHAVNFLDVRRDAFPPVDPAYHDDPINHPAEQVRKLADDASSIDGYIWATPVYHNSYSGALKCVIDHFTGPLLRDYPVALCGNGGRRGSTQAIDHLRQVARSFHAFAIPTVLVSASGDYALESQAFKLRNTMILQRAQSMSEELVWAAEVLRQKRDGGDRDRQQIIASARGD